MKKWWRSLVLVGLLVTLDCTVQDRAFSCGSKVDLGEFPCGRKLVNVTWKDSNLWFVTRPLHAGDVPEEYTFNESSSWGVMQGQVTFRERACP